MDHTTVRMLHRSVSWTENEKNDGYDLHWYENDYVAMKLIGNLSLLTPRMRLQTEDKE